jgi:hypothetical protein
MLGRALNDEGLQFIVFIDRFLQHPGWLGPDLGQVIQRCHVHAIERVFCAFGGDNAGFQTGSIAQCRQH